MGYQTIGAYRSGVCASSVNVSRRVKLFAKCKPCATGHGLIDGWGGSTSQNLQNAGRRYFRRTGVTQRGAF